MSPAVTRQTLHDGWTLRAVGGESAEAVDGAAVPASVPGCVHTDLLAAGLVPDPYLDRNELALTWIGRTDWEYRTSFDADAVADGERVDLALEGVDTVATVTLNDVEVAHLANMHRSYRLDVGDQLRAGTNDLRVSFAAAVPYAERMSEELGPRPHANAHPFNAIRKMACGFGWDWGPDVVTAGLWRPVHLERWRTARLAEVRPLVTVDGERGRVEVHVDVERASPTSSGELRVQVRVGQHETEGVVPAGGDSVVVTVEVASPQLWSPHGYGEQVLHDVEVVLSSAGEELDRWSQRIGFRTVALDTSPDEHGTAFAIVVNGRPVFAKGANWIPDDCFPHRVDRARYERRLRQARDAGIDLLRVWGGGIYESEDFYDLCDELGILVWQDFLFACAAYAEEEPLRSEVEAEAREAVARLVPHPSLAVWNGCNENLWGYQDWGWREQLADRTWGAGYYHDLLPAVVAELDPTRPYTPGSPYSAEGSRHPNDASSGTRHEWEVWNRLDYRHYRDAVPRFVSEFGFQGPPTWTTLTRAVHDDPLTPDSPGVLLHQKAEDGNAKLAHGLVGHVPGPAEPADWPMADWHWATQLNQARAVAFGIEHLRSWSPRCMGSVVWQLNDCWPVTSWAMVDGDGRRKPLWYAVRRAYAPRLLTVQPRDSGLAVVAVNGTDRPWAGEVHVARRRLDGTVLAEQHLDLDLLPRSTGTLALDGQVSTPTTPAGELLLVTSAHARALWWFVEDVELALGEPDLDVRVERVAGGYQLHLEARALVKDLTLLSDRAAPDAEADDALLTLLPGERATLLVRTDAALDSAALTDRTVLRSANQLVARTA